MAIKDKNWSFCFAFIHTGFLLVTFANKHCGVLVDILWRIVMRRNRQVCLRRIWHAQGNVVKDQQEDRCFVTCVINWAPSSEFVSSSIPSWQILTAHAQPFRGARDLAFCLKVPLDSLLVWASSGGPGETARMRRHAWTFAARIGDKYQIRLTRPNCKFASNKKNYSAYNSLVTHWVFWL